MGYYSNKVSNVDKSSSSPVNLRFVDIYKRNHFDNALPSVDCMHYCIAYPANVGSSCESNSTGALLVLRTLTSGVSLS